jgi:hypothetical protein
MWERERCSLRNDDLRPHACKPHYNTVSHWDQTLLPKLHMLVANELVHLQQHRMRRIVLGACCCCCCCCANFNRSNKEE